MTKKPYAAQVCSSMVSTPVIYYSFVNPGGMEG